MGLGPDTAPLNLPSHLARWAQHVERAASITGVPPSLIYAVMSRESQGENVLGDHGHGHGLMQIDDHSWARWLESHENGLDPESNVELGARILAGDIAFFERHKDAHPALADELLRLRAAIAAYNRGPGNILNDILEGLDVDARTTRGDYSRDVLRRRAEFFPQPESAS